MTMRIRVSHPLTFNGVPRAVGAVIDVDDSFGKRAISAGMARLATAAAIVPTTLDSGLELAINQRLRRAELAARLARPDTRLGPLVGAADLPVVTLNAASDTVTYNRGWNTTGTGTNIIGKHRDFADVGEGLDFDYLTTWQGNFSGFQLIPRSIRFMTDSDKVCVALASSAPLINNGFALYVDGQPVQATPFVPGTAQALGLHMLVFPSARPRLIEVRASTYLAALYTTKPYRIWKPPPRRGPRTLIIGDSWTSNALVTANIMNSAYWNIGPHFNSDDVWLDYFGGTGYTVTNAGDGVSGTQNRYIDRVDANLVLSGKTWDIEAINPELVVVHGGGANDIFKGKTDTQIIDGVVDVFSRLRERLPNARLVFVEGFAPPGFTPSTYNPRFIAIRQGAQAQLNAVGVYYIDVATTDPWFKGMGTTAAPNADGENANAYITTDTLHKNDAGHLYLRNRMGAALRRVLLDDGTKLNGLITTGVA